MTQTTEHTPMRETIYLFSNIHVEKDVHAHGLKQQSPLCQCADAQQQRAAMSGVGVGGWGESPGLTVLLLLPQLQ